MRKLVNLIYLFLLTPLFVLGQEYGYTRYDLKEGLAGSTVHCMVQDKDGFLWFGTETGLSRFDGTHFKNFTQQDGLPDDDIIKLYADKKGRVWISPFKKSICYYYRGKIYNQQNNEVLKKINVRNLIVRFAEDELGNILVQEQNQLHLIQANGQVSTIDQINGQPIRALMTIAPAPEGGFWVVDEARVYKWVHNRFTLLETLAFPSQHYLTVVLTNDIWIWRHGVELMAVRSLRSNNYFTFRYSLDQANYCVIDNNQLAVCSSSGVVVYDVDNQQPTQYFLPNTSVFNVLKDYEGNLWFSTEGQGVYRLNSFYMQNLHAASMTKDKVNTQQVFAFAKYDSSVLVAADKDILFRLSVETGKPDKKPIPFSHINRFSRIPVTEIHIVNRHIVYATKLGLNKLTPGLTLEKYIAFIYTKAIFPYKNKLYVATNRGVVVVDIDKFIITDTLWPDRATTVFVDNDTVYIGTLNGLYCLLPNRSVEYLGNRFPAFRQRIAGIGKDSSGVFWIATFGAGIIGYKNGRIVAHINRQNGLTSNICRNIFIHQDAIWVGTEKGLNKIDLKRTGYPVLQYTTGDGLISDIINVVYVEGTKVFVGTPEGITFFDEQKIDRYSRCDLLFTDITISGQSKLWDTTAMLIPHSKNNIRFDYVGISYKSAGDIRYRYRLVGLDSTWRETRETFLSYPTLPSGDYELQLQAVNKFGVYSKIMTTRFTIEKLLWEKTWFRLLTGMVFIGLMALLVWGIIYRIRRREQEKTAINKRIGDLEQLARKAQMNPHFIFNSLNSIQQYVMDTDLAGANKFISGFSRLIRQTLDFSSRKEISLEEELDYLRNYLDLEQTRLENAFTWEVIMEDIIDPADYYLPPMILQPFVENSVRHGLRFRKDRQGKLRIIIKKINTELVCVVEDNGVGRKAAKMLKSNSHIEYQSKGMSLTADRIALLNKSNHHKITMQIKDLEDEQQKALGTRVTLIFPIA
jgi:ligand-binding sensor domain-containing protein